MKNSKSMVMLLVLALGLGLYFFVLKGDKCCDQCLGEAGEDGKKALVCFTDGKQNTDNCVDACEAKCCEVPKGCGEACEKACCAKDE